MADGVSGFTRYAGSCWRAVMPGREAAVLDGTVHAGRYNRPGERTLYMSGSVEGVAAAMPRYGEAERVLVRLEVEAEQLIDLRDVAACSALAIDARGAGDDWVAALDRDDVPPSWLVADPAREAGAAGLIDGSRRAPGEWHLALFDWGRTGARVRVVEPPSARDR